MSDNPFCHLFSEFYCKIRSHFSKNLRLAPKFSNPVKVKIGAVFRWKTHCFCNKLLYSRLRLCRSPSILEGIGSGFPWRLPGSATGPLLHCNGAAAATWRRARCDLAAALRLVSDRFLRENDCQKLAKFCVPKEPGGSPGVKRESKWSSCMRKIDTKCTRNARFWL